MQHTVVGLPPALATLAVSSGAGASPAPLAKPLLGAMQAQVRTRQTLTARKAGAEW